MDLWDVVDVMREVKREVSKAILGQDDLISRVLVAIFAGGHVMLEGKIGAGKTTLALSLARAMGLHLEIIRGSIDLLPKEIIGTLRERGDRYSVILGRLPLAQLLLFDEFNKAPPKIQNALLGPMQNRVVEIASVMEVDADEGIIDMEEAIKKGLVQRFYIRLRRPFIVVATQNPSSYTGGYPVVEGVRDRFLMWLLVNHPPEDKEVRIYNLSIIEGAEEKVNKVTTPQVVMESIKTVNEVPIGEALRTYVRRVIDLTRPDRVNQGEEIVLEGATPRAGMHLSRAALLWAAWKGRDFPTPEDVKEIAHDVLDHRVILTPTAIANGYTPRMVVDRALREAPVPEVGPYRI